MLKSCFANNIKVVVTGWKGIKSKLQKPISYNQLSKKITLKTPQRLLVFFDAYDIMFQQSADFFLGVYTHTFDTKIVYSAEKNCFPYNEKVCKRYRDDSDMTRMYPNKRPVKYLNSGVVIGVARDLASWFESSIAILESPTNTIDDDQELAAVLYLDQLRDNSTFESQKVVLDLSSALFMSMQESYSELEISAVDGRYLNSKTGKIPGLLHFNGPGYKEGVPDFEEKMWWFPGFVVSEEAGFETMEPSDGFIKYRDVCL